MPHSTSSVLIWSSSRITNSKFIYIQNNVSDLAIAGGKLPAEKPGVIGSGGDVVELQLQPFHARVFSADLDPGFQNELDLGVDQLFQHLIGLADYHCHRQCLRIESSNGPGSGKKIALLGHCVMRPGDALNGGDSTVKGKHDAFDQAGAVSQIRPITFM